MVQKYKSPVRIYNHPFEIVMAAYEKRFPTCPMIPVFLSSDIIKEETSEDGAVTVIERRCKLNVDVPYLLKKIIGVDYCLFIQKNTLDRKKRVLYIEAWNESFSSRITVTESCVYSVHPENREWTCFEQEAGLEIKSFFGFEKAVEKIAIQQYSQNIKKGKEVIEHYINELTEAGITYIPPWIPTISVDLSVATKVNTIAGLIDSTVVISERETTHVQTRLSSSSANKNDQEPSTLRHVASAAVVKASEVSLHDEFTDSAFLSMSTASLVDPVASPSLQVPCSSKDIKPKLSAEYIRRHLGDLSPAEESALVQLREMLSESHKNIDKMPKYSVMLRFLRAHADPQGEGDFSHIDRAHDMLCRSLAWRKMHAVDRLLETYDPPSLLSENSHYWPCGWHGNDKQGRPVYILRLGRMDVKGILRSIGVAGVIRHVLAAEEEGIRRTEIATREFGYAVTTCMCVVDLEGLSMRHLWRPGVKFFLDLLNMLSQHYPESLSQLLIVRAPLIFPLIWAVTAPFVDDRTRAKFMVYGGHDCLGLADFIDVESLPKSLGGQCKCNSSCCAAGESSQQISLVPKSHYHYSVLELERDGLPLSDDYKTVQLCAHYPHEAAFWVSQPGSLITWDFDVVRGDITFSLFYVGDYPLEGPRHVHTACSSSSNPTVCGVTCGKGTTQYLDPKSTQPSSASDSSCTDGVLELVDRVIHCRDGDSHQGSHVVQRVGTYVLQWRFRPTSGTSTAASPTSHAPAATGLNAQTSLSPPQASSLTASGGSSPVNVQADSLFASAMSSIAAATSGRVTLVYFADVLPMSAPANIACDTISNASSLSVDVLTNDSRAIVSADAAVAGCWQSAASLPSPGSSSSNFAAFFAASSATTQQGCSVKTSLVATSFEEKDETLKS